ncbi:hypothetical protein V6Z11_A04G081400 [Gossypium hirsutum]|uniref:RNase H type-1 domain-containing protein n=1 Tax=Gossypium hirsutum TaxID=3635 RepID=A0A1U8NFV1_GOSHI|nr:uncharacterized protein LOC107947906 [Gossypium hirsutum]
MNQIEKDLLLNVGAQWNVLSGDVCWCVWKNRNAFVFNSTLTSSELVLKQSIAYAKHIIQSILPKPVQQGGVQQLVHWEGPPPGWAKLNIDGGVDIGTRLGPVGWLLHDKHGNQILGYCLSDGVLDVLQAKL